MIERASGQKEKQVFGLGAIRIFRICMMIFIVFITSLFSSCGQADNQIEEETTVADASEIDEESEIEEGTEIAEESETKVKTQTEEEPESKETPEMHKESDQDSDWSPYDAIEDAIYQYYGRERYEKISAEEIEAVRGKLPAYSLTIHSGEEFALMREWYDGTGVHTVTVYFSEDLEEWPEEELQALAFFKDTVYVESDSKTFPARVLTYLTNAQEVYVGVNTDVADVTGTLSEGACFPEQVKTVTLSQYREGKYAALLRFLQDSQVEMLAVRPDTGTEESMVFWLDDVAGIDTLREVELKGISIRIREETSLAGCKIARIEGSIDQDTDLCFVEKLEQLEELNGRILEERDLLPLLHRKGLSLYLDFSWAVSGSKWNSKPDAGRTYTVCPAFNKEVSWQAESDGKSFLMIYQRRESRGKVAECFTERCVSHKEDETEMYSLNPWIRITDGTSVYELRPGEEQGGDFGFGEARMDELSMKDINFDGVEDIALDAGRFGNQGLCYEFGYLWNQKSGKYEFSPTYTMIGNPSVDPEHQLVRSSWRNSAVSHSWAIYKYMDGEFVIQSRLTEELLHEDEIPVELEAPEEAEVLRWQEEIMENGAVVEVNNSYAVQVEGEKTVYPEEYENYYAEDSYWG